MKIAYLHILVLFFAIFFSEEVEAQQLNYQRYSINEGLPQSEITDIIEDKRGVLWVGTHNGGLCRFNGKHFKVYTTKDGLADNFPRRIVESREGSLWIFGDKGITQFDGLKFRKLPHFDSYEQARPKFIFEDSKYQNVFWMLLGGNRNGTLVRLANDSIEQIKLFKNKPADRPFFLSQNSDGSLLITTKNGCYDYDYGKKEKRTSYLYTKADFPPSAVFYRAITDKLGRTWYNAKGDGFKSGIYREENDRIEHVDIPYNVDLKNHFGVCSDSKGDLWLSTTGYVVQFSGANFRHLGKELGLNGEVVSKCREDHQGNIWVGTKGSGLIRYTDDSFSSLDKDDGLPSESIRCVTTDKRGNVWFGLTTGSVAKFDGKQLTPYFYSGHHNVDITNSIVETSNGQLLFFTNGGVFKLLGNELIEITERYNLPSETSFGYVKAQADTLWAYTRQLGLVKLYNGQVKKWVRNRKGFKCNHVNSFTILKDGRIWVNTNKGPYWFNQKEFTPALSKGVIKQPVILQTTEDKAGNLWCATFGNGLLQLRNDSTFVFDMENSKLNTNIIYSIASDSVGNVWMGTQKGISKLVMNEEPQKSVIHNYDRFDGFKGLECNGSAIQIDDEGRVWFGTINGAIRFNPALRRLHSAPPLVHITGVDLFGDRIGDVLLKKDVSYSHIVPWFRTPKNLELSHNQNHLTFHFEGIDHIVPEKIKYKWFLKGFDRRWSRVSNEPFAVYSNLPAGNYTFKVKASTSTGVWTKKAITYRFVIEAPFWQTKWFVVLAVIGSILVILFLIRLREKVLKRENETLEERVIIRTAEILQQKEEIETQRDEIETQRDEIETQRDEIQLQRDYVMLQRDEVARANSNVTDSIRYAKRIQSAVMPPIDSLQNYIEKSFIFFKPRDIVSGDFYWFRQFNDTLVIAAVDCTGHGVPGAIMSMLGMSLMNELVAKADEVSPSALLEVMRQRVKVALRQTGKANEQHDGMDMAVLSINQKDMVMRYAGAHNPALLLRNLKHPCDLPLQFNNTKENVGLYELKSTANPIGIHAKEEPFKEYKTKLYPGDTLYIYSDGFNDQFGGKYGHRYMARRLKKLLINNYHLPMSEQAEFLNNTLEDWQQDLRQIDDILVVGLRV